MKKKRNDDKSLMKAESVATDGALAEAEPEGSLFTYEYYDDEKKITVKAQAVFQFRIAK